MWIPVGLLALLLIVYLSLDRVMTWVTQDRLDKLEGMVGSFSDVVVTVWPPGYDVHDLKIREEPLDNGKEALVYARRIEMKWAWRELVKARLVRRVKVWNAKFVVDRTPKVVTPKEVLAKKVKKELPPPQKTAEKLESMEPFRLERLEFVDSQVLLLDRSEGSVPRLWLHDVQATMENFTSRREMSYGKPVLLSARAVVQRSGKLDAFLTADPLDDGLTFAGEARLRGMKLAQLHELMTAKTGLKIPRGTLDIFASFKCKRGMLEGAVKPILKDVDTEAATPGLGAKIKSALADAAIHLVSDRVPGREAVAAIIPIHGDLRNPNLQLWPTVLSVIRNAFVEGLASGFDNLPPKKAPEKEGVLHQARRALSKKSAEPVKTQPEK